MVIEDFFVLQTQYRADTSALFWFMVFFTLALLVALIALIICFLFAGCPLYINRYVCAGFFFFYSLLI
jgi:hypothetical protein